MWSAWGKRPGWSLSAPPSRTTIIVRGGAAPPTTLDVRLPHTYTHAVANTRRGLTERRSEGKVWD